MPDVTAYVEDRQTSEFYPTPEKLVQRMLGKIKWDPVEAILEPSAGKGDILRGLATAPIRKTQLNRISIDCIEIDPNLRAILKYSFSVRIIILLLLSSLRICSLWERGCDI